MPLFDYLCQDCGKPSEILLVTAGDVPSCNHCGSRNLKKLLSAHSQYTGQQSSHYPDRKIQPAAALHLTIPDAPVLEAAAENAEKELAG